MVRSVAVHLYMHSTNWLIPCVPPEVDPLHLHKNINASAALADSLFSVVQPLAFTNTQYCWHTKISVAGTPPVTCLHKTLPPPRFAVHEAPGVCRIS